MKLTYFDASKMSDAEKDRLIESASKIANLALERMRFVELERQLKTIPPEGMLEALMPLGPKSS